MNAVLPNITLALLCLALALHRPGASWAFGKRQAILVAGAVWGAFVVGLTEVLSLWDGLTPTALALVWSAAILAVLAWGGWRWRGGGRWGGANLRPYTVAIGDC
jgi:hypothetical protein